MQEGHESLCTRVDLFQLAPSLLKGLDVQHLSGPDHAVAGAGAIVEYLHGDVKNVPRFWRRLQDFEKRLWKDPVPLDDTIQVLCPAWGSPTRKNKMF